MRQSWKNFMVGCAGPECRLDEDLVALIDCVQRACHSIATVAAQGTLAGMTKSVVGINVQGEEQMVLDVLANDILLECCDDSDQLCGMVSEELADPCRTTRRGRYLLLVDPLDGSSNINVGMVTGTIFSILRAPAGVLDPWIGDFLQPGANQVAAGYALYGPATQIVLTWGAGTHGFTLDRESGEFLLTHPNMRVPESTREFAINASNRRFWEPPVRQYVDECLEGVAGPRGGDFNMRWIASLVAEVHRILIRGGIFMYPRDTKDFTKPGRLRLLYEANPMAMLVEQAGGLASTGRQRLLDLVPQSLHQRVPVVIGSRREVERVVGYYEAYDRGEDIVFETPLFHGRSLYRSA
jgi:fructose-1,6-bisphosphatase